MWQLEVQVCLCFGESMAWLQREPWNFFPGDDRSGLIRITPRPSAGAPKIGEILGPRGHRKPLTV